MTTPKIEQASEGAGLRGEHPSIDLIDLLNRTRVTTIMAPSVTCVDSDLGLDEVATILARAKVHTAPVVEDTGILIGVVSRGDLLRARGAGAMS